MNDTPVNTDRKVYPETHSKDYQLHVQGYTYNDYQLGNSDTLYGKTSFNRTPETKKVKLLSYYQRHHLFRILGHWPLRY